MNSTGQLRSSNKPSDRLELGPFKNHPLFVGKDDPDARRSFQQALAKVRSQLGRSYSLFVAGSDLTTDKTFRSVNPADPDEVIGVICQATEAQLDQAIQAAQEAFLDWRDVPASVRVKYLLAAAELLRKRIYYYSAWQVLEEGKQWDQAYNDVAEAIDFLEYYSRQALQLDHLLDLGSYASEKNEYFYQPKGLTAVIAPWNFPLAISCGMVSAAIAVGSCVLYKPSSQSAVVGHHLVEVFREVGLPSGVFNYLPGPGSLVGQYLAEDPRIAVIAFTGSMEVGLKLTELAAKPRPGQDHLKKVIAEMGGKNAIIIDEDADQDRAISAVLYSAFGYQGQKCSACSRLIVVDRVYDRFVPRLVESAARLKIGPAEDPANYMGPVIDQAAQQKIQSYIDLAAKEGKIICRSDVPKKGFYVPMTIVEGITPDCRIAQEEIFGPVLAVMRTRDFDQAIEWANSTRFALTGAVFSRNRQHLEQARRHFRVGNLYFNRHCVGAMVKVQPFGGFKLSGTGTKAGGPDYLLHFVDPRCVTEQPM
ncbi:MAG: L-glutamate gamma-semialdehyde dehydrogenase [Sedimentisphaerales bacterium]|nr:L-glutamate gamma-semialdehyde dehydrogenase [Sedimentisphaerales bacterium]